MISEYNKTMIGKSIKRNIFYLLLANPNIYLKILLLRTFWIGVFTFIIGVIVKLMDWGSYTIPSSMHSLIGIVIGLLLVFRTNTAYDRWWDGRKIIGNLSSEVALIVARLNAISGNGYAYNFDERGLFQRNGRIIKAELDIFLKTLCKYLISGRENKQSRIFHIAQNESIEKLLISLNMYNNTDHNLRGLHSSFGKILDYSNQLERIKNTPIPMSYVFHIKVSVLIYLITLPFGMFHDLGLWAVPLVMLIYYIIAGVEIISSEIENPFAGDPNDLPTEKLFNLMKETLDKN